MSKRAIEKIKKLINKLCNKLFMETPQMAKKKRLSKNAEFYFCNNGSYNIKIYNGDQIPEGFVPRSFIYRH